MTQLALPGAAYLAAALLTLTGLAAQGHETAQAMQQAAQAWLASVPSNLAAQATFELKSAERENWHFIPKERKGASLGEMNDRQRELVHQLLRSALSEHGFLQATSIVGLEVILKEIEQGGGPVRDPGRYYLSLFGKPGPTNTWGWRFEGHHLSLNFLVIEGHDVTVAPSFFGSNPADVKRKEGDSLRILRQEEDLGRAFANSLDAEQRGVGIINATAPRDIITGANRTATRLDPLGIGWTALTPEQQRKLEELVQTYVNRYRPELAQEDLARIAKAGWEKVAFAWAGSLEKGQGHYYRVQGPTFLLEYDNTQNRANHIHTAWRDLERDFGGDLLQEHYRKAGDHR